MANILIADDEKEIVRLLRIYIEANDNKVFEANDGETALQILKSEAIDLAIVDIMMPGKNGYEIIKAVRKISNMPILAISAKVDLPDRVFGIDLGADDYITKPFGIMELISRVKALLRRSMGTGEEEPLFADPIMLDGIKRMVYVHGQPCTLTYKEYELLKFLLQNRGIVLSRDVIMERIWDVSFEGESRTLDVHIKTLRQKLGSAGRLIKTVRNVGYRIE